MTIEDVKKHIRDVYDFPVQGIVFKDLTTAFKDAECMRFFEEAGDFQFYFPVARFTTLRWASQSLT